jgi:hypothetical protein
MDLWFLPVLTRTLKPMPSTRIKEICKDKTVESTSRDTSDRWGTHRFAFGTEGPCFENG